MILPKDMCDDISYYTADSINKSGIMYDRIDIYFKQWWKRKKRFDMKRNELEDKKDWWRRSTSCIQLIDLLDQIVRQSWDEDTHEITGEEGNVVSVNFNKED